MTVIILNITWEIRESTQAIYKNYFKILQVNEIQELRSRLNFNSIIFITIVALVTTTICFYREIYIEDYNNKKFLTLIILFFTSIIILVTSNSILITIIGWEVLGISSLILVIFYPNKTRKTNSIVTIFFNRIGDVILILVLATIIRNIRLRLAIDKLTPQLHTVITLIIICRLTKRAQFPMSAWLPAAISAPTPISAMVHSSTLVTAGIFLIISINELVKTTIIAKGFIILRTLRILTGGTIANFEKDFKKIVAFSTIRQIRIIITITIITTLALTRAHMINHAIFKTLLFCASGIIFSIFLGQQTYLKLEISSNKTFLNSLFLIRIFRMSRLIISTSYFSKDLLIENQIEKQLSLFTIILISRGILTLLYCIKINKKIRNKIKSPNNFIRKNFKTKRITILITLTLIVIITPFIKKTILIITPQITYLEIISITTIIISPLAIKKRLTEKKTIIRMTKSIILIKQIIVTKVKPKTKRKNIINLIKRELIFLKKRYLRKKIKKNWKWEKILSINGILWIIFTISTLRG